MNEALFKGELGEDYEKFNDLFEQKGTGLLGILSDPASLWFDRKETPWVETREVIVIESLERTYAWFPNKYGHPERRDWMKMNFFLLVIPLGRFLF